MVRVAALIAASVSCTAPPAVAPERALTGAQEADVAPASAALSAVWPTRTRYRSVQVLGHRIFYREAGEPGRPLLLLLHGYPSSSHTYRELIPLLSGRFHVIAPDNLGSGYSDHPRTDELTYTFDLLADHLVAFTDALELERYSLYLQDFGGPVGFRLALRHPERVEALIVQNANGYLEGLTPARRAFFEKAHVDRSPEQLRALGDWVSDSAIRDRQYLRDAPGERAQYVSPDAWTHDLAMLPTPEDRQIQVQLFQDYQTNIDAYPAWQAFLRQRRPRTLVLWGERDAAFMVDGARAYLRDVPDAELQLLDAGHFAVEERAVEVAERVTRFLMRTSAQPR
jgi:pimeloyl-ACP methyl ester carboxylesterase